MSRDSAQGIKPDWPMVNVDALPSVPSSAAAAGEASVGMSFVRRSSRFLRQLHTVSHVRLWLVQVLNSLIPYMVAPGLRRGLYRMAGFKGIGDGVFILGRIDLRGRRGFERNLTIGDYTGVNSYCLFDLGGKITIGKKVNIGHNVMLLTTNHQIGPPGHRCGAFQFGDVVIGDGSWLGASVIVLPDVTIGSGAVVAAGSVVTKSVPANAMVAGNPARVVGWLESPNASRGS